MGTVHSTTNSCVTHFTHRGCAAQVFINLDLNTLSLARGVAIAVFAPVPGEGGIALVNGSLSGTLQPA